MNKILKNIYKSTVRSCKNHFGHREYRKFVVVTRSRTGSTFLRYLLKSHPNIVSHDEPFNRLRGSTCLEIWNSTFSCEYSWTKYVGFKIFYCHPNDSDDQEIWDIIKSDKEIRIIHLKRENMLRTYVSRQIAGKSGVWREIDSKKGLTAEEKCVEIDLDDCLEEFARIRNWESDTKTNFRNHPYIEVEYEDLVAKNAGTMDIIFDFLEVPRREVKSRVRKQNPEALQDLVSNYEELKRTLSMAGFDHFLDSD